MIRWPGRFASPTLLLVLGAALVSTAGLARADTLPSWSYSWSGNVPGKLTATLPSSDGAGGLGNGVITLLEAPGASMPPGGADHIQAVKISTFGTLEAPALDH